MNEYYARISEIIKRKGCHSFGVKLAGSACDAFLILIGTAFVVYFMHISQLAQETTGQSVFVYAIVSCGVAACIYSVIYQNFNIYIIPYPEYRIVILDQMDLKGVIVFGWFRVCLVVSYPVCIFFGVQSQFTIDALFYVFLIYVVMCGAMSMIFFAKFRVIDIAARDVNEIALRSLSIVLKTKDGGSYHVCAGLIGKYFLRREIRKIR